MNTVRRHHEATRSLVWGQAKTRGIVCSALDSAFSCRVLLNRYSCRSQD